MISSRITMTKLTWRTLALCLLLLCGAIVTFALGSDTANAPGG